MKTDESSSKKEWTRRRGRGHAYIKGPLVLVGAVLSLWVLLQLKVLIIALIFAVTLASAIAPVAESLENKKVPRWITVAVIFLVVGLIYSLLVAALFPTLKEQALSLYSNLPNYADSIGNAYARLRESLGESVPAGEFTVSPDEIKNIATKTTAHLLHMTSDIVSVGATVILVIFLTAYFVVEANALWPKILEWFPKGKRERAASLIRPIESRLGGYIRGQLLVCVAVSTFLTIGLSILQVDHWLLLGALSGLLNLVPFVGSMITAVLAIVVAFNQSHQLALYVFLLFAAEQWVESNLIVPNLLGKQVELHPLIVLFAILIGASLLGVAGALIAVPIATVLVLLAQEFYLKPLKEKEGELAAQPTSDVELNSFAEAAAIPAETPSAPSSNSSSNKDEQVLDISETSRDSQKK